MSLKIGAHFDGETYVPENDWQRLTVQLGRVWQCMRDGKWRTLERISFLTGDPEASVSARLRDLRKKKFGANKVFRKSAGNGLYLYKVRSK